MNRLLASLAALLLMAACAAPQRLSPATPSHRDAADDEEVAGVHTDLVRSMLAQRQYYAALAHIAELQNRYGKRDELLVLQAEALRELDRDDEATAIYRELLRGRYAAEANHGLGLIHAPTRLATGLAYLGEAVRQRPTDVEMRNDYGYALIRGRRYEQALTQLATAMELAPSNTRARNNLLILLMVTGDEAGVRRVAAAAGLENQTLAALRRQAARLQAGGAAAP